MYPDNPLLCLFSTSQRYLLSPLHRLKQYRIPQDFAQIPNSKQTKTGWWGPLGWLREPSEEEEGLQPADCLLALLPPYTANRLPWGTLPPSPWLYLSTTNSKSCPTNMQAWEANTIDFFFFPMEGKAKAQRDQGLHFAANDILLLNFSST